MTKKQAIDTLIKKGWEFIGFTVRTYELRDPQGVRHFYGLKDLRRKADHVDFWGLDADSVSIKKVAQPTWQPEYNGLLYVCNQKEVL